MIDGKKTGVGIITCNRKDCFWKLFSQIKQYDEIDHIVVVKNKDFDYGPEWEQLNDSKSEKLTAISILDDCGVGHCKNTALQTLQAYGCEHFFLIEDDIEILDQTVFGKYAAAAEHFKLGHLNWNSLPDIKAHNRVYVIADGDFKLDISFKLCGCFSYFSKAALETAGLIDDLNYINVAEHAEHAYRMSLKGLTTPFYAFAGVADSDKMLKNIGEGSSTINHSDQLYRQRLINANKSFFKTYGKKMTDIPVPSQNDVKRFLCEKVYGHLIKAAKAVKNPDSPRYTVLCYNINHYEIVHEIKEKDPEAEYLMITDDPSLQSQTWKVIYDKNLQGMSTFDKCYAIRFGLFKYAHADICLYLDANIGVNRSLKKLIDIFEDGNYDMSMMPHPLNSTFLPEYKTWIKIRSYPKSQAVKFFKLLQDSKYDLNYRSLFQGCFKIVRRGKLNDDFDRMTLAFLKYLGTENEIERLDQTIYSFVMNQWFRDIKLLPVSEQILRSSYMTWFWHASNNPNTNWFMKPGHPDKKFVFNQETECLQLLD